MIKARLISLVSDSKKYIVGNVMLQWCSLIANAFMIGQISALLAALATQDFTQKLLYQSLIVIIIAIFIRFVCATGAARMGYASSKEVKRILREQIFGKLHRLGASYNEQVQTSEIVQVSVEGVEQLETYFGAYLPQFFYAMLAPLTLFMMISFINVQSAIVLLVCVPMIPMSIVMVQKWAKRLLSKYWGEYTALGDTFLENLQGLTTLKIYQADEMKHKEMNEASEQFRKITMKVLTMQLNSITIMDFIAYGGAAIGMIMAVTQFQKGHINLEECLFIILIAADFFIPMRQLGSFFHIAMNGMAASDKIFKLLDLPEKEQTDCIAWPKSDEIRCENLQFSYDETREILHGVNLSFKKGEFTAIVGESGCGKSTIAGILMSRMKGYSGTVKVGEVELSKIKETSLMEHITYIGHQSYLFKGTVRDNLLMGKRNATDEELWQVLEQVNLTDYLRDENGLDTFLQEKAANISGGQRQRLALARALLHDTDMYIFDEATSNIDVESENDIMHEIYELSKSKTILLISHRLANSVHADQIYVMENGNVVQRGKHKELLEKEGVYQTLWTAQQQLENFGKEGKFS